MFQVSIKLQTISREELGQIWQTSKKTLVINIIKKIEQTSDLIIHHNNTTSNKCGSDFAKIILRID